MTPKEVLDGLIAYANIYASVMGGKTKLMIEGIPLLQDLVAKATPMKTIIFDVGCDFHVCPNCAVNVNRFNNYCAYCGQKLDWGDEK